MIYTRFYTPVTLISPIDQDGWVTVRMEYGDNEERKFHTSELKADNGYNEIIDASNALVEQSRQHLCRDCWRPMETILQGEHIIVTCKHNDCTLFGVTLSDDQYAALTREQLDGYRKMVQQYKERKERYS